MINLHPKVLEYLIKSYFYVGSYSYDYFLETLGVLPLSKKFDITEAKNRWRENEKKSAPNITPEGLEQIESIVWSLKEKQGELYKELFSYIKSLNNEDIYRLLLVLLPDSSFDRMSRDKWNCWGENVKDWYNDLLHYLDVCGIKYDSEKRQLVSSQEGLDIKKIIARADLIDIKFEDIFYRNLATEINTCHKMAAYTAAFILSRKLIENLVIDILRKKFPVSETNLEIYYRPKEGRFHDLAVLLKNLEDRKEKFGIDESIIEEFFKLIKPFRSIANSNTHSIIIWGDKDSLEKLQIEKMVGLLLKIFTNIPNN